MTASGEQPSAYQPHTKHGPVVRSDVVDVYVFARAGSNHPLVRARTARPVDEPDGWPSSRSTDARGTIFFLQVLRAGPPMENTWHPVMGHVHAGESAAECALREMREELNLAPRSRVINGMWALEQVYPFFIAAINTIVMSPRFCVEVEFDFVPTLNEEHSSFRWIHEDDVDRHFMWPGQKACCREILREIVDDRSLSRDLLRIPLDALP